MTDPYKVLGVPTTATDDEVKAAYRRLAKKYHPDANPGDKVAEQRMKEINAAYDQIMNKTASGANQGYGGYSSGGYAGYDPFGRNYGGYGSDGAAGDPKLQAAYNYIAFGRYHEALNVLSSITDRGAKWYYYSALANSGLATPPPRLSMRAPPRGWSRTIRSTPNCSNVCRRAARTMRLSAATAAGGYTTAPAGRAACASARSRRRWCACICGFAVGRGALLSPRQPCPKAEQGGDEQYCHGYAAGDACGLKALLKGGEHVPFKAEAHRVIYARAGHERHV